jgi:hypothetical protein
VKSNSQTSVRGLKYAEGLRRFWIVFLGQFTESFAAIVSATVYIQPDTTVQATALPEPSTLLTLATMLLGSGGWRLYWRG